MSRRWVRCIRPSDGRGQTAPLCASHQHGSAATALLLATRCQQSLSRSEGHDGRHGCEGVPGAGSRPHASAGACANGSGSSSGGRGPVRRERQGGESAGRGAVQPTPVRQAPELVTYRSPCAGVVPFPSWTLIPLCRDRVRGDGHDLHDPPVVGPQHALGHARPAVRDPTSAASSRATPASTWPSSLRSRSA